MSIYENVAGTFAPSVIDAALDSVSHVPYWLDDPERPSALPALEGATETDLLVVGGGYSGLWTALMAKERDPNRDVVLIEGETVGWAASGRNGGFCEASLVHGDSNGRQHLPNENDLLRQLGLENLHELAETIERYNIDCEFTFSGVLKLATEEHQVQWLKDEAKQYPELKFMDQETVRGSVHSPVYKAGLWDKDGTAMINPAKLAWGLRRVCLEKGVRIYENTWAKDLTDTPIDITVTTTAGSVTAQRVALATNVFPSLLKRHRLYTIPVYDYAIMTEPLTEEQVESLGWKDQQGLADLNNRFHYYRMTRDANGAARILFGGFDAEYYFGGKVRPEYDQKEETFRKLVEHFYFTFPQLEGTKFTHAWGGAIDSCSRFFSFFDKSHGGRVAYVAGFTGLGVGATRFAANVLLDLLSGKKTQRTELEMVKKKPIPFPPEPVAYVGVKMMTSELARADRNQGKRGVFLKTMDALGMGFDS
ncbi:FAD-dependent oxidoreductase [Arthrobacter sp. MYb227]|uniref:NAD(P)/FAD-dependent oxidoreductase n=1 Tax=Arthrobacter sp. MYb227 TaxID=1848601 RepID=UPI000CFC06BD|nr:FAD-dependent oxidoreductase [Arthrobacter sp. MYb227]PQZ94783.1 FAD-dependent oxidoreductase [Arthrobacter sp. MYb227]